MVDLYCSGTDYRQFRGGTNTDIAVIFSGNGAVEGYYYNGQRYSATAPIFLLIGSQSRVVTQPLPAAPNRNDLPNWADLANVWITINHQTGLVATSENYAVDLNDPNLDWTNMNTWSPFLAQSRNYARESQSMGGR